MQHQGHHIAEFKRKLWISLLITIPILLLSETIQTWLGITQLRIPFQKQILLLLSIFIYGYCGLPFLKGMFGELRNRQPGMMTLVGTAISVAFFYSAGTVLLPAGVTGTDFFWELATLVDVMLLGHWVEAKSVMGASRALEELARIMPTKAHVIRDDEVIDTPVSELQRGDVVLVRPGEKIPTDGIVVEGESSVNEALLTGESKPVNKIVENKVIAGSINQEGVLNVRVEKVGEETYLAQVIRLVRQAQESKSRTQDLANKAAALLFYVAIIVGAATYAAWSLLGNSAAALERSVTVLVIACPHALGLAIPLVVALSISITARSGILIRDRKAFETAKDVNVVVFDKTGTLTEGKLSVSDVVPFISESDLLKFAASVELNSEHMIAKAIVQYAEKKRVEFPRTEEFRAIPGKGAYGKTEDRRVYVGGPNLLEEMKIQADDQRIKTLQDQGKTVVFVIVDGSLAGVVALSDNLRKESYEAVRRLKQAGLRVYMLTGDSEEVARRVAKDLRIDDYFARVLPEKKAEKISFLKAERYRVAMVGDGVNDAPAIVTADVGIAIGAGTDVAVESADVILVRNDPRDVVKVIDLARRTYSKMVQNLWWAAGYNLITIPLAAGVLAGFNVILPPAFGALLMSLSTVIVALNSQTLRKYEPKGTRFIEEKRMVIDPVCGMHLEPTMAYSSIEYRGRTAYFCSKKCEDEFRKNPEKFVSKVEKKEKNEVKDHH